MAGARGVRAGAAFIEMWLDDNRVVRGLKKLRARLRAFGATVNAAGMKMIAIGAAMAGAFIPAVKAASRLQETMNKFNVVFGANAQAVKGWSDNFAKQVGRSKQQIADFMAGTQDLFVPLGFDAATATNMSKQLTGLAIDLASFNNKADADVLRDLHAALTGSSEVMKKYGVIVNMAAVNQELFNQGIDPKNATEQQKVFARLAIIMRGTTAAQGDAIRSAGAFENQWKRLLGVLDDAAAAVGKALLPSLATIASALSDAIVVFTKWAEQNRGLVVLLAQVAAVVLTVGVGLVAFGTAFGGLGMIVSGVTGVVGLFGSALSMLAGPVGIVLGAIALVGAQLVALTATWLTTTTAGGVALSWLSKHFVRLKDVAIKTMGGIGDAMAAGDIALAAKILWLTLKMEWQRGVHFLNNIWQTASTFFQETWTNAVFATSKNLVNALSGMSSGWVETVGFMEDVWALFLNALQTGWRTSIGFIEKGWLKLKSLVTGEDTTAQQKDIDKRVAAGNAAGRDTMLSGVGDRDRDRRKRLAAIDAQRRDTLSNLDSEQGRRKAAIDRKHAASLSGTQRDLNKAQDEWRKAIALAKSKRDELPDELGGLPTVQDLKNKLGAAAGTAGKAAETRGTFSAFALRGMQSGGPAERTAKATESTAKSTRAIDEKLAESRGVLFSN